MAFEPGTALAIVALGIRVCDGILKYCGGITNRKGDVKSLTAVATQLQNILKDMQSWLESHPTLNDTFVNRLDGCTKTCLAQIDEVLAMCNHHSSGHQRPQISHGLRKEKTSIPISERYNTELEAAHGIYSSECHNCSEPPIFVWCLHLMFIACISNTFRHFTFEGFEALQMAIHDSEAKMAVSICARINEAEQKITSHVKSSGTLLHGSIQQLENSTSIKLSEQTKIITESATRVSEDLAQSTSSRIRQVELSIAQEHEYLRQEIKYDAISLIHEINELKQLIHLQRSTQSLQNQSDTALAPHSGFSSRLQPQKQSNPSLEIPTTCTCNPRFGKNRYPWCPQRWFQWSRDSCLVHERDCPLWYTSRRDITVEINVRFRRLYLAGAIELQGSYYSWRNWSVSPSRSLRFQVTVPSNTGAFAILNNTQRELQCLPVSHHESVMEGCLLELHKAFAGGKASPYDVNEQGDNLLHALICTYCVDDVKKYLTFIRKLQSFWPKILYDLINEAGVTGKLTSAKVIIERCTFNMMPYDVFQSGENFRLLLDFLIHSGVDISEAVNSVQPNVCFLWCGLNYTSLLRHPHILFQNSPLEFVHAIGCNSLSMAILRRDERSLREELETHPEFCRHINPLGQNVLHLAAGWKRGLDILLKSSLITNSLLSQRDRQEYYAFDYAAIQNNLESVTALLEVNAPFSANKIFEASPKCRKLLLSTLYERRRQLRDMAIQQPDFKDFEYQAFFHNFFFDSASRAYLQSLRQNDIAIPDHLASSVLSTDTLFGRDYGVTKLHADLGHGLAPRYHIAQELMNAGFIHVDDDWEGETPLMALSAVPFEGKFLEDIILTAEILLQKGADPTKEIAFQYQNRDYEDDRRYRIIHQITVLIGRLGLISRMFTKLQTASSLQREIFHSLKDPCCCSCAPGGCNAFVCMLKCITAEPAGQRSLTLHLLSRRLEELGLSHECYLASVVDYIRIVTFESLELTHTCCVYDRWTLWPRLLPRRRVESQVEINRIHEEEKIGLQLLESLMGEFVATFVDLGVCLEDFFNGYWRKRMEEELYKDGPIKEDELDRQRELGVWLTKENNSEKGFFERLWVQDEEFCLK